VEHVSRLDPRLSEAKRADNEAREKRMRRDRNRVEAERKQRAAEAAAYREAAWADNTEEVDRMIDAHLRADENAAADGDASDGDAAGRDPDEFYCELCGKAFKSERQWGNHEKSKRHREKVAWAREALAIDGFDNIGNDDDRDAPQTPPLSAAMSPGKVDSADAFLAAAAADAASSGKKKKKKKNRGNAAAMVDGSNPDPDPEPEQAGPGPGPAGAGCETGQGGAADNVGQDGDPGGDKDGPGGDPDSKGDSEHQDPVVPTGKTVFVPKPKRGAAALKREKRAAAAKAAAAGAASGAGPSADPFASDSDGEERPHKCTICTARFSSKTKLFAHIRAEGHAALKTVVADDAAAPPKGKGKKKKQQQR
jgi:DnaJ family protein A protein 5